MRRRTIRRPAPVTRVRRRSSFNDREWFRRNRSEIRRRLNLWAGKANGRRV